MRYRTSCIVGFVFTACSTCRMPASTFCCPRSLCRRHGLRGWRFNFLLVTLEIDHDPFDSLKSIVGLLKRLRWTPFDDFACHLSRLWSCSAVNDLLIEPLQHVLGSKRTVGICPWSEEGCNPRRPQSRSLGIQKPTMVTVEATINNMKSIKPSPPPQTTTFPSPCHKISSLRT